MTSSSLDAALSTAEPKPARKRRNRESTREELRRALERVKERGDKLSISAVASEAGVTPSLIHNTYPDVAEEIRARLGRNTRQQRDAKAVEVTDAKALHRTLRAERDAALADLAKAVSINETLRRELDTLRGVALGKVTALRPGSAS